MALETSAPVTQYGIGYSANSDFNSQYSAAGGFGSTIGAWFDPNYENRRNEYNAAIDREYNAEQAALTWERNEQSAQNQRDYDERMRRNQYTYAIEDLKRAGINPVMAVQGLGGTGASGSAASAGSSASSHSSGNSRGSNLIEQAFQAVGKILAGYVGAKTPHTNISIKKRG
ncbi:DNA pilot protein [Dipodfec virus UOA04_Rod_734]|nr:DNA pilot protein [Dipodfec virus UOA04_Rod_734]